MSLPHLDIVEDRKHVVTVVVDMGAPGSLEALAEAEIAAGRFIARPVETEMIHGWFGLTYANYLVLNRSLLQSMPDSWQARFVGCLEELRDAYSHLDHPDTDRAYNVTVRSASGRFRGDPIPHYNRGRTRVALRDGWKELP